MANMCAIKNETVVAFMSIITSLHILQRGTNIESLFKLQFRSFITRNSCQSTHYNISVHF